MRSGLEPDDSAAQRDYHELQFSGFAQDVIDSASFSGGLGQLSSFPAEPALAAFDYSIVPGNLGQAWLGTNPDRFVTITNASIQIDNGLDMRVREFGSSVPQGIAPGSRNVSLALTLFERDEDATKSLYQAARQQSPVSVMFQLGEQPGQVMGIYLKSVVPEVPQFDDGESWLQWKFQGARAQGTTDDEVVVAFA
jgi:hypothetical protein